jgi:hypothetical protein
MVHVKSYLQTNNEMNNLQITYFHKIYGIFNVFHFKKVDFKDDIVKVGSKLGSYNNLLDSLLNTLF